MVNLSVNRQIISSISIKQPPLSCREPSGRGAGIFINGGSIIGASGPGAFNISVQPAPSAASNRGGSVFIGSGSTIGYMPPAASHSQSRGRPPRHPAPSRQQYHTALAQPQAPAAIDQLVHAAHQLAHDATSRAAQITHDANALVNSHINGNPHGVVANVADWFNGTQTVASMHLGGIGGISGRVTTDNRGGISVSGVIGGKSYSIDV